MRTSGTHNEEAELEGVDGHAENEGHCDATPKNTGRLFHVTILPSRPLMLACMHNVTARIDNIQHFRVLFSNTSNTKHTCQILSLFNSSDML